MLNFDTKESNGSRINFMSNKTDDDSGPNLSLTENDNNASQSRMSKRKSDYFELRDRMRKPNIVSNRFPRRWFSILTYSILCYIIVEYRRNPITHNESSGTNPSISPAAPAEAERVNQLNKPTSKKNFIIPRESMEINKIIITANPWEIPSHIYPTWEQVVRVWGIRKRCRHPCRF